MLTHMLDSSPFWGRLGGYATGKFPEPECGLKRYRQFKRPDSPRNRQILEKILATKKSEENSLIKENMLTLHHLQRSQSERIVWLCEELGVEYELKTYPRDPKTMQCPPELQAL